MPISTQKENPSVSVVIPCYKAASTLGAALDGVLAQTIQDFEIICVDDGSPDDGAAQVFERSRAEPRIKLIRQANGGVSKARNVGIAAARGAYIATLDADDVWNPVFLERSIGHLQNNPDVGVCFTQMRFLAPNGVPTGEKTRAQTAGLGASHFLEGNPTSSCSALVARRAVFDEAGLYDEGMRRAEDQEWLLRVALTRWKISGIDEALADYRNSPAGLASDLDGMLAGFELVLDRARGYAPALANSGENSARAGILMYLARRALRLRHGQAAARSYALRAIEADRSILLRKPAQMLGLLTVAAIPGLPQIVLGRRAAA